MELRRRNGPFLACLLKFLFDPFDLFGGELSALVASWISWLVCSLCLHHGAHEVRRKRGALRVMEADEEWETGAGTGTTGEIWRFLSIFLQLFC